MKNRKKTSLPIVIFVWILAIVCVLAVFAFSAFTMWNYQLSPISSPENETTYKLKVQNGMSVSEVSQILQNENIIRSWKTFYAAVRFNLFRDSVPFTLKAGTYTLKSSMSLKEIYDTVQLGTPEYITVVIPEGLTRRKIASIIEDSGICSAEDFLLATENPDILSDFSIYSNSAEGYLFPDTYYFNEEATSDTIVRQMIENFFSRLKSIETSKNLSSASLYRTIILASIVEREYRVEEEAARIAGVFENRLKIDMPLESCATIEYVITEELGKPHPTRIYYKDLEIENPYNTYRNRGLPPNPISNPGIVALKAAIEPEKTDYLFFVLTDSEKGTHTFSKTFQAHESAKNQAYFTPKGIK